MYTSKLKIKTSSVNVWRSLCWCPGLSYCLVTSSISQGRPQKKPADRNCWDDSEAPFTSFIAVKHFTTFPGEGKSPPTFTCLQKSIIIVAIIASRIVASYKYGNDNNIIMAKRLSVPYQTRLTASEQKSTEEPRSAQPTRGKLRSCIPTYFSGN